MTTKNDGDLQTVEVETKNNEGIITLTQKQLEALIDSKLQQKLANTSFDNGNQKINEANQIKPPTIGSKNITLSSKALKEITALVPKDTLEIANDPNGDNMRNLLKILKNHIQKEGIDEEGCFNVLANVLPNSIATYVNSMKDLSSSFDYIWSNLQTSQCGNQSSSFLRKEIAKITENFSADLGSNLREIVVLNTRLGNFISNPKEREISVITLARQDLYKYLYNFYPFRAASIEAAYNDLKNLAERNKETQFHPLASLINLACSSLANVAPQNTKVKVNAQETEIQTCAILANQQNPSGANRANFREKPNGNPNFSQSGSRPGRYQNSNKRCHLCNYASHLISECRLFENKAFDLKVTCQYCGGHHLAPCFKLGRAQNPQNGQYVQRNQSSRYGSNNQTGQYGSNPQNGYGSNHRNSYGPNHQNGHYGQNYPNGQRSQNNPNFRQNQNGFRGQNFGNQDFRGQNAQVHASNVQRQEYVESPPNDEQAGNSGESNPNRF